MQLGWNAVLFDERHDLNYQNGMSSKGNHHQDSPVAEIKVIDKMGNLPTVFAPLFSSDETAVSNSHPQNCTR
jgi:hypothetical protein